MDMPDEKHNMTEKCQTLKQRTTHNMKTSLVSKEIGWKVKDNRSFSNTPGYLWKLAHCSEYILQYLVCSKTTKSREKSLSVAPVTNSAC